MDLVKKISDEEILNIAIDVLSQYIHIETISKAVNTESFLKNFIGIAAMNSSINTFPDKFKESLTPKQLRYHLNKLNFKEIEQAINKALPHYVPHSLSYKFMSHKFAIDFQEQPYHGEPDEDENEIRRSKAKSGTTHFHTYATIYLMKNGKRYTLAMKFVKKGDNLVAIIEFLINQVLGLGFKIKRLYLDKGFYNVEVINYLQKRGFPFIIPVAMRGRKGEDGKSSIERLFKGKRSYITEYTMESIKNGVKARATFKLYIVTKIKKGKNGRRKYEYYAYCLSDNKFPIKRLYNEYRLRFGIETSYRKKNESLGRTSSRKVSLRLLYTGLSFFLINTWIFLAWNFLSKKQKGKRVILTSKFIYERFCDLIFNALKTVLKYRPEIEYIEEVPSYSFLNS